MKALGVDEAATSLLVLKQRAAPEAVGKTKEVVEKFAALVDTYNGMLKRAVAVAKKLETWYEVDADHPDAQALQAEWCGN
jgi:hypothetical protein